MGTGHQVLLFAQHEAAKNCVEQLVDGLDQKFSDDQIKRRMQNLGLRMRHGRNRLVGVPMKGAGGR